jgi:hypothetical protein
MKSLFEDSTRLEIHERILKLTPDSARKWGSMTPAIMLNHITDGLRVAFAETPVTIKKSFLTTRFAQWLIIDSPMPWPKNTPTAPEYYLKTQPADFEADRQTFLKYLDKFAQGPEQRWGDHPAFGKLTPQQTAKLNYRHINHHLMQFGC